LISLFETVDTHGALLCLDSRLIAFENRGAVRAGIPACPASVACLAIEQYSPVLLFFAKGSYRTLVNTERFFAMIAWHPLNVDAEVGKTALLILIDPQIF
jgi:hypothetical protein